MNNGGREALLWRLLDFDLRQVNIREIPLTAALLDQKLASASAEEKFWFDTLRSGRLPGAHETEPNACLKRRFQDAYVRHANRMGVRHLASETKLGIFVADYAGSALVGDLKIPYTVYAPNGDKLKRRGNAYKFPPLKECRERFEVKINQGVDWGCVAEWQADELIEIERADEEEAPF